jgi:hypothetical protein
MKRHHFLTFLSILTLLFTATNSFGQRTHSPEELDSLRENYGVFYGLEDALKHKDEVKHLILVGSRLRKFPKEVLQLPNIWGISFKEVRTYYTEEELEKKKIKLVNDTYYKPERDKYRKQGYRKFADVRDPPVKKKIHAPFKGIPSKILEQMKDLKKLEWLNLEGTKTTKKQKEKIRLVLPDCEVL